MKRFRCSSKSTFLLSEAKSSMEIGPYSLLILLCLTSALSSTRVPLIGADWTISSIGGNYTIPARIPGTIHTNLLAADRIPEPYLGYNDVSLRFLVYSNWVFAKNFSLPAAILASDQIILRFEQIDTVADISINACPIGSTNSMFVPYAFRVASSCLSLDNQIRIVFQSPVIYAADQAKAYNDSVPPNCTAEVQNGECHVQFIRKEPCSFSWDWVSKNGTLSRSLERFSLF